MSTLTYRIELDGLPYLGCSSYSTDLRPDHYGLATHPERLALWEAARQGDRVAAAALVDWYEDRSVVRAAN